MPDLVLYLTLKGVVDRGRDRDYTDPKSLNSHFLEFRSGMREEAGGTRRKMRSPNLLPNVFSVKLGFCPFSRQTLKRDGKGVA